MEIAEAVSSSSFLYYQLQKGKLNTAAGISAVVT